MLDKKSFCLIVDAMKEKYDRDINIYKDLKKYDIYYDEGKNPLNTMLEKLIDLHFNQYDADYILSYCYPIGEREDITTEELYNEITGEHD